eukprot:2668540-Prymnesium_polylepis.1
MARPRAEAPKEGAKITVPPSVQLLPCVLLQPGAPKPPLQGTWRQEVPALLLSKGLPPARSHALSMAARDANGLMCDRLSPSCLAVHPPLPPPPPPPSHSPAAEARRRAQARPPGSNPTDHTV